MEQERKKRQEEAKIKQGKVGSSRYNNILYRYRFSSIFSLLDLACMVLHVVVFCHGMGFSMCESFFRLAFPFLDSLDEMGSHTMVELDCQMESNLSGVDLQNEKQMA